jgi:LmbE family N-acetylglucosaminyl deacetylase
MAQTVKLVSNPSVDAAAWSRPSETDADHATVATRDVFVVAHQDDWQLFMGDVAEERLKVDDAASFIYLTAGDDGRDSSYWRTRERAALQSTRAALGTAIDADSIQCSDVIVRGHSIKRCLLGRTASYFLRLPDGRRNGAGFARSANQTMRKLRSAKIAGITTVDRSATYSGWKDLVATVGDLIRDSADAQITVHTFDPSITINPHDHFDHRAAGLVVTELRIPAWNERLYVGYAVGTRASNRSSDAAREKTRLFLAYNDELIRANPKWNAYQEHPRFYSQCMTRTYARTFKSHGESNQVPAK